MNPGLRHVPREKDDLVLRWVALRQRGFTPSEIRRVSGSGVTHTNIANTIERVRKDDLLCGEDPAEVARHYWTPMRNYK